MPHRLEAWSSWRWGVGLKVSRTGRWGRTRFGVGNIFRLTCGPVKALACQWSFQLIIATLLPTKMHKDKAIQWLYSFIFMHFSWDSQVGMTWRFHSTVTRGRLNQIKTVEGQKAYYRPLPIFLPYSFFLPVLANHIDICLLYLVGRGDVARLSLSNFR